MKPLSIIFLFWVGFGCQTYKPSSETNESLIELGHYLFFDPQLSHNKTKSCASCHNPEFAFTDGYRTSITSDGINLPRNSPSLLNLENYTFYTLADTGYTSLKKQHQKPLYAKHPVELGFFKDSAIFFKALAFHPIYKTLLEKAGIKRLNDYWLRTAIAAYVASLSSHNSAYDKFINGDTNALSIPQKKGMQLFFSKQLQCAECHKPPEFTLNSKENTIQTIYRKREGNYMDSGLYLSSKNSSDIFKFRIPSLRNVALTSPYFHDGSMPDLKSVMNYYINNPEEKGKDNKKKMTAEESNAIIQFLYCLTDSSIFANPLFKNPFND